MPKKEKRIKPRLAFSPEQVRAFRAAQKLSRRVLAERSGVSESMVRSIEESKRMPSIRIVIALCAALEVDIHDVLVKPAKGTR